ncbi:MULTISPECIES: zinc-binding dehydrogenase [unclassified Nocardioides]|uniref:zinc-binding dehydrogenase n=1 Tax=unclassified Nocardioides TaxID=2615069 RepID=UPI000702F9BC|nr:MULTISPECIES: zinc-binding dehydrogenase [unclassified Nocardioides]KRC56848.1 oxidoreductase [Nocardioides sp. Root79]KRC77057.1 oxidoreductase [Nocardioides sp. Root240]
MHAIRHHAFGPASVLQLEELPDLEPAAGQLRIAVEAAGVHLLDTSIRAGEAFGLGEPPELPVVPGREVAGVVDRVGAGVDGAWVGRRVVAHLGFAGGGYADQAVVDATRAYALPDHLDAPTAVAAIGTGRTAAAILALAAITPEDAVAVTSAAGGLGVLLLQGVRAIGAAALGVAGGADKVAVAAKHGAEPALDRRAPGWLGQVGPLTVVLDGVGGEVGQALYERLVPGGRLIRYGWASGVQNAYDDPARPVVDVLGPPIMSRLAEFERAALDAAADGSRVPYVGSVFPLEEAAAAHRALEEGTSVGKVVLAVGR